MHDMQSPTFKNGQRVLHFMFGITRTKGQKACVQQINIRKTFFILIFYIDLILIIHAKVVLHMPSPNMPSCQHAFPSHHQTCHLTNMHAPLTKLPSCLIAKYLSTCHVITSSSSSSIHTGIHTGILCQWIRANLISWDVNRKAVAFEPQSHGVLPGLPHDREPNVM